MLNHEPLRLADGEYRFACLVWDNEPLPSGQLVALAAEGLGWKKSTTYTVLKKLCERGVLQNADGRVTSLIKKEDVQQAESAAVVDKTFDGSLPRFVAAFLNSKPISDAEAAEIVKTIYASGYPDRMVLQKMVPGGDDHMRVLTAFSDENGKVRAMCLGHTMVEEHTPHGLGNHAAIVSEDTTSLPLVENIRKMLEACRYTGFSNFDIKYSGTPGDYRVFEINLRQGRSNYYVTATGMNIARLVVEKWNDGGTDCVLNKNEVFWHHVPAQVAFTYTEDKDLVARAKALKAQGKEACSLLYKPDLLWNPVRYACVLEQLRRQFKKFKTYYPVHK